MSLARVVGWWGGFEVTAGRKVTFLLVEDNPLDVIALERECEDMGFAHDIVRAEHGRQAFDMLKGSSESPALSRPIVILLDINMPVMNGHQFLDALRTERSLADIPVIVFTTSTAQRDLDQAFDRQVAGYLVKSEKDGQLCRQLAFLESYAVLSELPG